MERGILSSSPVTCNFSVSTHACVHVASAQGKFGRRIGAARKLPLLVKNSPRMAESNTLSVSQSSNTPLHV